MPSKLGIKINEPASQPSPNICGADWGKQIFMPRGGSVTEITLIKQNSVPGFHSVNASSDCKQHFSCSKGDS